MHLENNRLKVEVLEPGTEYARSRFDWSAIVKQIHLDNQFTFCSQESSEAGPGTEGLGLSCEFGIHTAIGYDELSPGEWFPKIGIGKLQKESLEPYDFFHDYKINPIPFQISMNDKLSVEFLQDSGDINGYAWKLRRQILLKENTLSLHTRLENTGIKDIVTEEYCHNFLQLNKEEVDSNYKLILPGDESFIQEDGVLVKNGALSPAKKPKSYFYAKASPYDIHGSKTWELSCRKTPAKVTVQENFEVDQFAVWGMKHVMSPEFFIQLSLAPGASKIWERKYTFTS